MSRTRLAEDPTVVTATRSILAAHDPATLFRYIRRFDPGWGAGTSFYLPLLPRDFQFVLEARPSILRFCTEEELAELRIARCMEMVFGRQPRGAPWVKSDFSWGHWLALDAAVRMTGFSAYSRVNHEFAVSSGARWKRLGSYVPSGYSKGYEACSSCQIAKRTRLEINREFEPGALYGPFSWCTHPKLGCRCLVFYEW